MACHKKKLPLAEMAAILLIATIVISAAALGGRDPAPVTMLILQSQGRSTNPVLTEVFLLTNR